MRPRFTSRCRSSGQAGVDRDRICRRQSNRATLRDEGDGAGTMTNPAGSSRVRPGRGRGCGDANRRRPNSHLGHLAAKQSVALADHIVHGGRGNGRSGSGSLAGRSIEIDARLKVCHPFFRCLAEPRICRHDFDHVRAHWSGGTPSQPIFLTDPLRARTQGRGGRISHSAICRCRDGRVGRMLTGRIARGLT
jgi:hypothetical protein